MSDPSSLCKEAPQCDRSTRHSAAGLMKAQKEWKHLAKVKVPSISERGRPFLTHTTPPAPFARTMRNTLENTQSLNHRQCTSIAGVGPRQGGGLSGVREEINTRCFI